MMERKATKLQPHLYKFWIRWTYQEMGGRMKIAFNLLVYLLSYELCGSCQVWDWPWLRFDIMNCAARARYETGLSSGLSDCSAIFPPSKTQWIPSRPIGQAFLPTIDCSRLLADILALSIPDRKFPSNLVGPVRQAPFGLKDFDFDSSAWDQTSCILPSPLSSTFDFLDAYFCPSFAPACNTSVGCCGILSRWTKRPYDRLPIHRVSRWCYKPRRRERNTLAPSWSSSLSHCNQKMTISESWILEFAVLFSLRDASLRGFGPWERVALLHFQTRFQGWPRLFASESSWFKRFWENYGCTHSSWDVANLWVCRILVAHRQKDCVWRRIKTSMSERRNFGPWFCFRQSGELSS